ncbi:group 3 secretory phospholipase A2-like isoform X2 [Kryptolebias marmoratus]|uniref:group 3 secretory phospholipase A2-like isoform X2 n=1 Tax=Kryptolebias marmoratus TaxID=37003 RepID=UPI0018ACD9E4|nr:group 3 secretory phospholipase A2-like isoform X2 [Kryptolebias marmoratus]
MGGGWLLRAVFFSSCLMLLKAQPGVSCLRSTLSSDGRTLVTFLRQDAAGARLLYLTKWAEGARLLACQISQVSPGVAEGYGASCGDDESRGQAPTRGFDISALLFRDAPCALAPTRAPELTERAEGRGRRKRSWMFPGTLWCGSGSKAVGYEQLGMFERADRCCREHDHCSRIIPAFTVNYGVFNPNFYTVSHCECDQRFRQCLLDMNDSISSMVGYSFFSILKVPCFELKQMKRCTQMYWWGMCKVAKKAPYAVFKSPLPYNSSEVSGQYVQTDSRNLTNGGEERLTESHTLSPQRKPSKTEQACGVRDPPRGDTFHHRTKGRGCKSCRKISGPGPSQVSTTPRTRITTRSTTSQTLSANKKRPGKKKSVRKSLTGLKQRSHNPQKGLTSSAPRTPTTTRSPVPPSTQRLKPQHKPTTEVKGVTKSTKSKNKLPKQSICCGSSVSTRNDSSQLYCKSCLEQETATHMKTITLGKTNSKGLTINWMEKKRAHLQKRTEKSNQHTSGTVWSAAIFPTPIVTKQMTTASLYEDGKSQKGLFLHLLSNRTSQQPSGGPAAGSIPAEQSPTSKNRQRNATDNQLQCRSLKHLDECKFKIPPLEKKYNLRNTESKTAYHCDCTSRLAAQIESVGLLSVPRSLLADFVSERCFTLPEEKKYVPKASIKPLTYIKHLRSGRKTTQRREFLVTERKGFLFASISTA